MSETYLQRLAAVRNGFVTEAPKERIGIKPISDKRAAKLAEEKKALAGDDTVKEKWFQARRREMVGTCIFCGGKTEKDNDLTFRNSIAHLLPKKDGIGGVPSIKIHPENWIELCYYGNSCHSNFDNGTITWDFLRDSAEWELIVAKFKILYPCIDPSERKYIPEFLLKDL